MHTGGTLSTAPLLLRGKLQASSIASQRLITYPGQHALHKELPGMLVDGLREEVVVFVPVGGLGSTFYELINKRASETYWNTVKRYN